MCASSALRLMLASIVVSTSRAFSLGLHTQQHAIIRTNSKRQSVQHLHMVPRFDKSTQKWFPTTEADKDGYPLIGSLFRQGPKCFFTRLINPDKYEQAVYKYMASEGVSRNEAQGNMDAFFENPNDWIYQKNAEKNGAPKYDYANANMDPQQIVLSSVWAIFIISLLSKVLYQLATGDRSAPWQ